MSSGQWRQLLAARQCKFVPLSAANLFEVCVKLGQYSQWESRYLCSKLLPLLNL